ncbi:MBL fold metallo-hydrolase [Parapedobacter tibetensis]|uniref:MBL fold metallo-hydrolase n=1 Tax=Parapedobacter tibetensis TaxID=2972951 RepID=UPI00214DEB3B|nr:MBL fold metallo-hydrolase [Parapedobacter tibetensis]
MENSKISIQELQELLNEKQPVFILDIRPQQQWEEWRIADSFHKDAYTELNNGDKNILDDINAPRNVPIVTVCAAGRVSQIATGLLNEKGYEAYSLEGGMKAWNYAWNKAEYTLEHTDVKIIQVRRVAKGCLSYIIGSGGEAIVVDASLDPEVYLDIAKEHNWTIRYVMDTHIHADYIARTRELAAASRAKHMLINNAEVEYPYTSIENHQAICFGDAELRVLHTPGHTWESTSYLINDTALLSGDTLFIDGVGRPDLKADGEEVVRKAGSLFDSLQRILSLQPDTIVLPAHTAGAVPFDGKIIKQSLAALMTEIDLLSLEKEAFIEVSLHRIPPTPPNYLTIAALNKKGSYEGVIPADLEAGANRCAIG